jgi:hypothetical protein
MSQDGGPQCTGEANQNYNLETADRVLGRPIDTIQPEKDSYKKECIRTSGRGTISVEKEPYFVLHGVNGRLP